MNTATVLAAQGLPFLAPAVLVVLWLLAPTGEKVDLGLTTLAAVALTAVLVTIAGLLWLDPRPFVLDPAHPALFDHSADNGFPSDHTAYAATAALLVTSLRRRLGLVLLAVTVAGGLARVLAQVHHLADIAGGLLVAVVAVAVTLSLRAAILRRRRPIVDDVAGPPPSAVTRSP